jgi:hypothetical protein
MTSELDKDDPNASASQRVHLIRQRAARIGAILCALVLIPPILWGLYSIDDEVTDGDAYGFSIGQPKDAVVETLKMADSEWRVAYVGLDERFRMVEVRNISDVDLPNAGVVTLARDESAFLNTLRLEFAGARLVKMYRNRQLLEFP